MIFVAKIFIGNADCLLEQNRIVDTYRKMVTKLTLINNEALCEAQGISFVLKFVCAGRELELTLIPEATVKEHSGVVDVEFYIQQLLNMISEYEIVYLIAAEDPVRELELQML